MKIKTLAEVDLLEALTGASEDTLLTLVLGAYGQRQKLVEVSRLVYELCKMLSEESPRERRQIAEEIRRLLKLPCPTCGKE